MNALRGISLKLGSVVLFVVMSAMIKATAPDVPAGEAVFFRSFFAMPVILLWLAQRHELSTGLRTNDPVGHLWRGLIGVSAMGCTFAGLGLLPLPEVTAIGFAAPILTVLFGALLLGEKVRAFRMSAVAAGLIGVSIIVWPRLTLDDATRGAAMGVGLVLLASVFRALVQIQLRRLVAKEETSAIVFYFSLTSTLLALCTLPFGWVIPDAQDAALLVAAGVIGGIAQILITSAYRFGEAGLLAPFDYASMIFALILGYVVFGDVPTVWMLCGAAIVIASGVAIILRERHLGLKRGRTRAGMTPQG
ncbi:DMT family transporter [Roseivivax marinus]|uniref:DMT family transporter n=1 Tax=Roseivivax marinus TaxID=1379903 RepID=UPI0008C72C6B|nr:DMT family transporter [Roseivivax marinus]UMA64794.1 DMT family transporter [Roseivivax marinus]SEL24642.1 Permease of the drug/metabolite transporter (DMT) superfamily [Roseivivax marinus]